MKAEALKRAAAPRRQGGGAQAHPGSQSRKVKHRSQRRSQDALPFGCSCSLPAKSVRRRRISLLSPKVGSRPRKCASELKRSNMPHLPRLLRTMSRYTHYAPAARRSSERQMFTRSRLRPSKRARRFFVKTHAQFGPPLWIWLRAQSDLPSIQRTATKCC